MTDPPGRFARIRRALTPAEWTRFFAMVGVVVALHVAGWLMLAAAMGGHYQISKTTVFGLGTGALAYTLGMRHAFDADHIAAIDNTTRKLTDAVLDVHVRTGDPALLAAATRCADLIDPAE